MPLSPNVAGQMYALTVLTPIDPGRLDHLSHYSTDAPDAEPDDAYGWRRTSRAG